MVSKNTAYTHYIYTRQHTNDIICAEYFSDKNYEILFSQLFK